MTASRRINAVHIFTGHTLGAKSPAGGAPMQLSRVDLNLFTIFDAIYRDGGITPASKRLHLSQPAVSHALAPAARVAGRSAVRAARPRHDADAAGALARRERRDFARRAGTAAAAHRAFRSGHEPALASRSRCARSTSCRSCRCSSSACSAKPRTSISRSCASIAATSKRTCRAARSTSPSMSACRCPTTCDASA